jgi:hypothetical protein
MHAHDDKDDENPLATIKLEIGNPEVDISAKQTAKIRNPEKHISANQIVIIYLTIFRISII